MLSHDLLEGSLARCGAGHRCRTGGGFPDPLRGGNLAPASLGAWRLAASALHFRPQYGVTALGRWKMFDNLRRSLTPIAWFFASRARLVFHGSARPLIWQMLLIFSLFVAPTLSLINWRRAAPSDIIARSHLRNVWADFTAPMRRLRCASSSSPHSACMMADAIVRSLYRLFVSRKLCCSGGPPPACRPTARAASVSYYKAMWACAGACPCWRRSSSPSRRCDDAFVVGLPFALLWLLSPFRLVVSQSAETEDRLDVAEADAQRRCVRSRAGPGVFSRPS